jgi:hypothetical protein
MSRFSASMGFGMAAAVCFSIKSEKECYPVELTELEEAKGGRGYKVLKSDQGIEVARWHTSYLPKQGNVRNCPCPCGSGKKYKACGMIDHPVSFRSTSR